MRLPARPAVKRSGTSCPWQDAPSRHSTECLATMGASQQWRAQLSSQPAPASQPKRTRIPATPYALRSDAPPRRPLRSGAPPSRAAQPDAPRPPRAPSGQTPRPPPFDQEPPSVTRRATGTPAHLFPVQPGHTPPASRLRLTKRPGCPTRSRRRSSALRHRLCGRAHVPARLHGTALRSPPSFRPAFAAVAPSQRTRTARDGTSRRPYHASETPGRARALSRTLEKGAPSWPTPHWSPERQAASGKPSAFCSPATATIWSP